MNLVETAVDLATANLAQILMLLPNPVGVLMSNVTPDFSVF